MHTEKNQVEKKQSSSLKTPTSDLRSKPIDPVDFVEKDVGNAKLDAKNERFEDQVGSHSSKNVSKGYGSKPDIVGMPHSPKEYETMLSPNPRETQSGPPYLRSYWNEFSKGILTDESVQCVKAHCLKIGILGEEFDRLIARNQGNIEHLAWLL